MRNQICRQVGHDVCVVYRDLQGERGGEIFGSLIDECGTRLTEGLMIARFLLPGLIMAAVVSPAFAQAKKPCPVQSHDDIIAIIDEA